MKSHLENLTCIMAMLLFNGVGTVQENIVVNGSFEEPAVEISERFDVNTQGIAGWTIAGGSVDLNSTRWDSFHLKQSIDMAGTSPGTIEQTIKTNPSDSYFVSFVFANNPEIFTGQSVTGRLEIYGKGEIVFAESFTHSGSQANNMGYHSVQGCFTADAESCLLRIQAIDSVGGSRGIVVDDIRIQRYLPGDANGDGFVNLLDVSVFIHMVQASMFSVESDINCDGNVDLLDVEPFISLLAN